MLALLHRLGQVDLRAGLVIGGQGRDEIILDLHGVGGLQHEQGLSATHLVARRHQKLGHPTSVGGINRGGVVLIDGDLPFGDELLVERLRRDGLNRQRSSGCGVEPTPPIFRTFVSPRYSGRKPSLQLDYAGIASKLFGSIPL